jgi:GT2 family glycosyltransferase
MEKIKCKCENVEYGDYSRQVSILAPFIIIDSLGEPKPTIDFMEKGETKKGTWISIDICLAKEIAELWHLGIETTGCCCGHNKGFGYIGVLDKYIPKMLELGYKTAPGHTPDRKDEFYPKTYTQKINNACDVSIITPYYNEPLWMLKRNIESIRDQDTRYNMEHIIVIDNPDVSKDIMDYLRDTKEVYNSLFENYKLRVFVHDKNKGLSAARNTALEHSNGDYIMLLDTDDCFTRDKVGLQIDFMKDNKIDHSYGGFKPIHGNNPKPENEINIPPEFNRDYLLDFNNICYCGSNCFTREIYESLGGFDENMKEGAEDLEYWIRIAFRGYKIALYPKVLYYLGIHDSNMTAKLVNNGGFKRAYEYIRNRYPKLKFTI